MDLKNRRWEVDDSLIGFRPKKRFICPQCRPPWWKLWAIIPIMAASFGNVFNFSLRPPSERQKERYSERDAHALDVWMQCMRCGYTIVHGVPITKEEFDERFNKVVQSAIDQGLIPEGATVECL